MAAIPSKTGPFPFTPKRTSSSASTASTSSDPSNRLSRTITPNLLASTHKRYKAPLSAESRSKNFTKTKSVLSPVPGTPTKRDGSSSRPRTPVSPRKGAESPSLLPATSEMDVSNVDPEQVLVDYQMIEEAEISGEIDEAWLQAAMLDHGKQDKVMVSIRVRPSDNNPAWTPSPSTNSIKLEPNYAKNPTSGLNPVTFNFDAILTGSPNKPIYTTVARSHVHAAMEGYNAVIFAYGQTASGKTYTLSGDEEEPGIIPRAMRDVFGFIRQTPTREYLLRCSYLEIYNENIHDLLAPPSMAAANPVQIQGGSGNDVILTPLREEVVTSLKSVKEVLKRGEGNRRTACTDWNDRSSRSHSVFRLVIESRERGSSDDDDEPNSNGRHTPAPSGRQTPGGSGRQTPGPGGPRLQARGGRSVQTSVLSLIDLAGSEKATSDKERTREGKYINTSLLTLGTVIGTLADNAAKRKSDHVPFRNSKLTRMLQPSLSGNARISVICTINPDTGAVGESMSTLQFAKRIKNVQLHAQKKEVVDTDALIERYRKEIEDLKKRLAEREVEAPDRTRRLSAREQIDETKATRDLSSRIKQLTKLILTSQSVDETKGDESRPVSPSKIDFDMSPYQLQQELLAARTQLETQANQILSLEAVLISRPPLDAGAPESEKDRLIVEQTKTIKELEIVVKGYEENLGEPLRAVKEDVENEWKDRLEAEVQKREEKERWADELVKQLEKEKKARTKLEDERRALTAFVSKFDSLGLGLVSPSKLRSPMPTPGGAARVFAEKQQNKLPISAGPGSVFGPGKDVIDSPMRLPEMHKQPSLLDQVMPEEQWADDDLDFEMGLVDSTTAGVKTKTFEFGALKKPNGAGGTSAPRDVLGDKENIGPPVAAR
ncbi:kinesin-like protein [Macrolepiota fuliginosa MF-IS2]|uniref:Kinesin-like protein n=1 Tax=Macrolepiota fuliginosa MF-IS2 TaxID=1400762 RepID=A0A9P5X5X7_9AGAR|nr:kinesin-like protein [Macrolepiota fuliginosa MF-IS2]